uniref:Clp protease ATP binding subunit n=1 Tax=Pseudo-nitzschia americana TaxID=44446 RepID=UPI001D125979|nr:Clp protease ATP binding subunit [Pseudo-nitzschia americana]UBA15051.1 Clp protease ATP binding subunit [Pseudo-nitzschia americana]
MFEKFTEGAIKVIMLSQEEARRMGHNFVGTEQLLLGVIGQRHGIGARALKKIKITLKKTRKEIELYIGRGTGFVASEIPFTPRAKRVLEMAVHEGKDLGQNFVGTEHILLALIAEPDGVARRTLDKMRVNLPQLRNLVLAYIEETQEEMLRPLTQAEKYLLERERRGSQTPTLDEYAENISKEAVDGNLDPVIGREKEIDDVIATLARRTKNNPVLIGEPGVGKTAVAEGLAQLILTEKAPNFLDGSIIMALDLGSILAGTKYRGEFEERLKRIVEEAQNDSAVIVVIDEIHTLVGAGAAEGAVDAANILKPALARGKFRCIGATTNDEYRKYIERDPALERRFQPVRVDEPSVGTTIEILRGLRSKFEQHHALSYHDKALEQAAILSNKYIADRFLPDKAIDVIDEAGARVRLENRRLPKGLQILLTELQETIKDKEECIKDHDFDAARQLVDHELEVRTHIRIMKKSAAAQRKRLGIIREDIDIVNENDISNVISNWTGIPVTKLTGSESERLMKMEESLHKRLIGQEHAVSSVSKAVRRARVGLSSPDRPIASFIFAGPTGVGKTELTKALSDYMFSTEESMIRLDMSEFMEKHTVAKLIGSPPGYVGYNEGGQLTEAVRSTPYAVVLFDEVEKAHPDVFNLLLQILDDGRLSDSKGRVVDFTNTLIVMTTNLGSKIIERESGIQSKVQKGDDRKFKVTPDAILGWEPKEEGNGDPKLFARIKDLVHEELKNFFRPEFLNRIDEIIVFSHLTRLDIWRICGLMLNQIKKRLAEKDINLVVTLPVQAFLADEGYDPLYGARPLRRAIMKYLEDNLAEQCLSKTLYPKTKIIVRRKKLEDSVLTYTNELEVEVNFDDVDPSYFEGSNEFTDDSTKSLVNSLSESKAPESDIKNEPSQESGEDKKPRRFQKKRRLSIFERNKNNDGE